MDLRRRIASFQFAEAQSNCIVILIDSSVSPLRRFDRYVTPVISSNVLATRLFRILATI
jgi:hypothetical protein